MSPSFFDVGPRNSKLYKLKIPKEEEGRHHNIQNEIIDTYFCYLSMHPKGNFPIHILSSKLLWSQIWYESSFYHLLRVHVQYYKIFNGWLEFNWCEIIFFRSIDWQKFKMAPDGSTLNDLIFSKLKKISFTWINLLLSLHWCIPGSLLSKEILCVPALHMQRAATYTLYIIEDSMLAIVAQL